MKRFFWLFLSSLSVWLNHASADDIEIYFTKGAESEAYVLWMLDLRASTFNVIDKFTNFEVYDGTQAPANNVLTQAAYDKLIEFDNPEPEDQISTFQLFRAVLAGVLERKDEKENYVFDGINMALAGSNNYEAKGKRGDGGTILEGYKVLGGIPDGRSAIIEALKGIPGDLANPHEFGAKETYFEWYSYINGLDVQFGTSTEVNFDRHVTGEPVTDFDPDIMNDAQNRYLTPFDDLEECPQLFSVVVAMQGPPKGQDDSLNNQIEQVMGADAAFNVEAMMQYMHLSTTDLLPGINQVTPLSKSWVISDSGSIGATRDMAEAGGSGTPLSVSDPVKLEEELVNLLGEVLSVSSTFVAASVPVNVFNQTRTLDNLFVALFEAQDTLDWPGNIKKLKLADDPNDPDEIFDTIIDASSPPKPGFETTGPNRGRINYSALTYWTVPGELPPPDPNGPEDPNNPSYVPLGVDGRVVDRGGAGQKIPGFITAIIGNENNEDGESTRIVYVESESILDGNDNLVDFSTSLAVDATLQSLLGAADENEAEDLIRWGRGQDVDAQNNTSDPRFWIMGDAIHSRPLALNYGDTDGENGGYSESNPDIKLLFGSGDGMFHVIENTDAARNETGREIFSFYPRETLSQIKLRRAAPLMNDGRDMRYGVDGAPVVLTVDADEDGSLKSGGQDEAYVFFGLRRGGYSYYGMDIIDPANPKLIWKISQTRGDDNDSTFDELGLTFSTPIVGKVKYGAEPTDVLVFGGGYHGGWDPNDPGAVSQIGKDINADDDPYGNAIYIVNARTGELIWKTVKGNDTGGVDNTTFAHAQMDDSIPSDITALETQTGLIHRLYVGDTGGAVWRVDLPAVDESLNEDGNDRRSRWFVTRLADLSDGGNNDLRFFHAPDVVEAKDENTGVFFDGVIIQSGNRADPLDKRFAAADNYLFYLKDYQVTSGADSVIPDSNDLSQPRYDINDLPDRTGCPNGNPCQNLNGNGWKIEMQAAGEKGLSTPLVDAGRVFATTYVPGEEGVCGKPAEGSGRLYLVNLKDGSAAGKQRIYELGPGIPPGAVLVGDVILIPGGGIVDDLDGDGEIDRILTKSLTERIIPIYWREPGIDKL